MRIDSKGKYYTERISTEELEVMIITPENVVQGRVHIHPDRRLSDELNQNQPYIPVTDVTIRDKSGTVIYRADFLSLNKAAALYIIPVDALRTED